MTCRPQAPPGNLEWQQNSSKPTCLLRYLIDISDIGRKKLVKIRKKRQKWGEKKGKNTTKLVYIDFAYFR